jgi:hypothetical protein
LVDPAKAARRVAPRRFVDYQDSDRRTPEPRAALRTPSEDPMSTKSFTPVSFRAVATAALVVLGALAPGVALAAGAKGSPFGGMTNDDDGGGASGGFRSFILSIPVLTLNKEHLARLEFNLAGHASMTVEGTMKSRFEELTKEEQEETGESRSSAAKGVSLLFSRYTQPYAMAGFFFALGAGYRQEDVQWTVRPDEKDPAINLSLVDDDDDRLHHDMTLKGATGHLRVGYRYVGAEIPLLVGVFAGARHFQAGVEDVDPDDHDEDDDTRWAESTDREKERARRAYASKPEAGIEIGFCF